MPPDLALDPLEQRALEGARRREDPLVGAGRLVAGGQVIEQLDQIAADPVVAGQQAEVAVNARRAGVVVAGADVGIAAQAVEIAAHHQDHLGVRLEPDHAVHDVDAGALQPVGPLDVGRLVEARLDLDHHGDLLAVARRFDQVVDDAGARRGAIERHLDREHVRIAAGLVHEALDRGAERFVRMLEQDRAGLADDVEDVALVLELGVGDRVVGRVVQRRIADARDLEQVLQPERHGDVEHVLILAQPELRGEHAPAHRVHPLFHLEPHDRREAALPELRLDHHEEIVGLFLVLLNVGVARDPEELARLHLHAREQRIEIVRHHVLEAHEVVALADLEEARHARTDRHLDPRQDRILVVGVIQRDQEVQGQIGDERKRVRRVHRERRDQRKNVVEIVDAQRLLLRSAEVGPRAQRDVVPTQELEQLEIGGPDLARERAHERHAFVDLLFGRAAVDGQVLDPGADLLLEAADPLHEELVEIGIDDRQELDALEQRRARVLGLVQNTTVEGKPGELAVQIEFGGAQIWRRRGGPARVNSKGERDRAGCFAVCQGRLPIAAPGLRRLGKCWRRGGRCHRDLARPPSLVLRRPLLHDRPSCPSYSTIRGGRCRWWEIQTRASIALRRDIRVIARSFGRRATGLLRQS